MPGVQGPPPEAVLPPLTVGQVVRLFLPDYLQEYRVAPHPLKVLRHLADCRTGQSGYSLWDCAACHRSHWQPNGCGDRHCPSCQHTRQEQWLQRQRKDLLPVRYFHWVFTLPGQLRPLALQNPAALYHLLFDTASATLLQFGRQRWGAQLGLTALLHTFGQTLMDHPHLHCLVSGGGLALDPAGLPQWHGPQQTRWLFPVQAVRDMFRGKFLDGLQHRFATGQLQFHGQLAWLQDPPAFAQFLRSLRPKRWVVFAKGSVAGPEAVLEYLGRYTYRVAISNSRLSALDPKAGTVSFRYKDYAQGAQIKSMTLPGEEFIHRFLLHVLPPGFTKIRHYGLLGNNRRQRLIPLARQALEHSPLRFTPPASTAKPPRPPSTCPHCGSPQIRCLGRLSPHGQITLFGWRRLTPAPRPLALPGVDSS